VPPTRPYSATPEYRHREIGSQSLSAPPDYGDQATTPTWREQAPGYRDPDSAPRADYRGREVTSGPRSGAPAYGQQDTEVIPRFGSPATSVSPRSAPPDRGSAVSGGRRGGTIGLSEPETDRYAPARDREWASPAGRRPPERLDRQRDGEATDRAHEAADQRYWVTALWTMAWYAIPLLLTLGWVLLGGEGDQRGSALGAVAGALPTATTALLVSLLVAATLRWASRTWRPVWVGFAAAAVGAGIATVVFSAITGQSLS
jgi:hypothetical protein